MNELILSSDFFMIDLAADEPAWVKLEPTGKKPCARAAYGICTIGKDIIVCGGLGDDGAMSDLWKFNIGKMLNYPDYEHQDSCGANSTFFHFI
jgi:hypothetical protein